jgi:glutamate formiminotransferase
VRKLVECVPNFSEGRRKEVIDSLVAAAESGGALVLDIESDKDHNRSVLTFVGTPEQALASAYACVKQAVESIDLTKHQGEHPRIGAADVVPFVPLEGVSIEECVKLARELADRVAEELQVPVYFYEAAAKRPERRALPEIRKGGFEGLREDVKKDSARRPDVGGPLLHPTAGATVIGARKFLIAYNVNLKTQDLAMAKSIAKRIREKDGGMKAVRALGFELKELGCVQVSINVVDYETTGLGEIYREVERLAREGGVEVLESEVVGLVPRAAISKAFVALTKPRGFSDSQVLESRLEEKARLHEVSLERFAHLVASDSPTPGGGSVAAASVANGIALGVMVARAIERKGGGNLSHGLDSLLGMVLPLVEADARAFDLVSKAMKLPKSTPEEKARRKEAMHDAFREAAAVPLRVVSLGVRAAEDLGGVAEKCEPMMLSDVETGMHVLEAGVKGALANVRINLEALGAGAGSLPLMETTARREWKAAARRLEDAIASREMERAGARIELVPIEKLRPHEEFVREGVDFAKTRILRDGGLEKPVLVSREELVVLNGHHRTQALRELGAKKVPVLAVDYFSASISVEPFHGSGYDVMTKEMVLDAGRSGKLMPPKSSRHKVMFDVPARFFSLDEIGIVRPGA